MKRAAVLLLLLLLPTNLLAVDYDPDTLAGMDAVVADDWIAAVRAFEKALAGAPDDEARQERLEDARKAGVDFWVVRGKRLADLKSWEEAAVCAAVAVSLDPEGKRTRALVERVRYKTSLPEDVERLLAVCPAYPERGFLGRVAALESLGDDFGRAREIVEGCLGWLVKNQRPSGEWDCRAHGGSHPQYDVGVTGLALSALLDDGPAALSGKNREAIGKAAEFLARSQGGTGAFGGKASDHFLYPHCAATVALAEYAAIAGKTDALKSRLERARDIIAKAENPGSGWRYGIRPGDSDTSVTLWAVAALAAIRRAGIAVDDGPFVGALAWVDSVTDQTYGRAGYTEAGNGPARIEGLLDTFPPDQSESLTSAACLVRRYSGRGDAPLNEKGMELIAKVLPQARLPDMYYWHLGARTFVAYSGTVPRGWYRALVDSAAAHRAPDGSINPTGPWGKSGGRVMSTAFVALALSAPSSEPRPGRVTVRTTEFFTSGKRTVKVVPDGRATPTGIYFERGMNVRVDPSGQIQTVPGTKSVGPAGHKSKPKGRERLTRAGPYGCLLGRVGPHGKPFAIKREGKLRARGRGHLYLLVNDTDLSRATGSFEVEFSLD